MENESCPFSIIMQQSPPEHQSISRNFGVVDPASEKDEMNESSTLVYQSIGYESSPSSSLINCDFGPLSMDNCQRIWKPIVVSPMKWKNVWSYSLGDARRLTINYAYMMDEPSIAIKLSLHIRC